MILRKDKRDFKEQARTTKPHGVALCFPETPSFNIPLSADSLAGQTFLRMQLYSLISSQELSGIPEDHFIEMSACLMLGQTANGSSKSEVRLALSNKIAIKVDLH